LSLQDLFLYIKKFASLKRCAARGEVVAAEQPARARGLRETQSFLGGNHE